MELVQKIENRQKRSLHLVPFTSMRKPMGSPTVLRGAYACKISTRSRKLLKHAGLREGDLCGVKSVNHFATVLHITLPPWGSKDDQELHADI